MKTTLAENPGRSRGWYLVDAEGKALGRLAARIAVVLRGKDKPVFTPHVDMGSFVIVVNAEKVKLSGRKEEKKIYTDFSRFPGGLKKRTAAQIRQRHPDRLILQAVRGMLPSNSMGRTVFRRLKVYAGAEHPHEAQQPKKVELL